MSSLAWRQARRPQASGPQLSISFDSMLSPTCDADAAERFFRQVLQASHTRPPRVITVDKNAAYPMAFDLAHRAGDVLQG
jgi:transposase-like protein